MPAILDDPRSKANRPPVASSLLPNGISPRTLTLRNNSRATILPFASAASVPHSLLVRLHNLFTAEIEDGNTYPMTETLSFDEFTAYWFQNFAAVMVAGDVADWWRHRVAADNGRTATETQDADGHVNWENNCLGTFYIKPNYPGRSSHVCNAGFLVAPTARGCGVGRLLAEAYVDWAPRLGYCYSVFNLVYETNEASVRIWDALGFERIGRVKGCGRLKSYPDRLVDAIIYGKELKVNDGGGSEDPLQAN